MEEINKKYPQTVNVVFLNIVKPENQIFMKYFGVASIPTQVLLYKKGNEFFRHSGYYFDRRTFTKIKDKLILIG